jgi:raffinose/stachyose/melibiose transport system permease protein
LSNRRIKISFGYLLVRLYIFISVIVILVPVLWMFSLSFRTPDKMKESFLFIIPKSFTLDNYKDAIAWSLNNAQIPSIPTILYNTILITSIALIVTVFIAMIAAYAISRLKFKGKNAIFLFILSGMMIPVQAVLIPVFTLNRYFGLLNTHLAVILVYIAFGLPFTMFILKGFFDEIPIEISESARIDGASHLRILFNIFFPLAKPAIAACVIFLFLFFWNELILGMILLQKKELYTVQVALSRMSGGLNYFPIGKFSALIFITIIPIVAVFIIFQKWFIKGLTAGAIKG